MKKKSRKVNYTKLGMGLLLLVAGIAIIAAGVAVHGGLLTAGSAAALKLLV